MQKTKHPLTWNAWGETDTGQKRENNEDRILCDVERGIFVVADGMGGESAGEIAAQQAIDAIKNRLHQETGTVARRMREAIAGANNEVYRLAGRNPQWQGMACVLTAVVIEDGTLHIGHVGDSRLYKVVSRRIRKITSDHSPIGQREDAGELTELEAKGHPRRNEVYRDVGSQLHKPDDVDFIDYIQIPFESDAALILCTDGLSDMLASNEILQTVIESAGRPWDSVRQLIKKANSAGGNDNIAAIVIEADGFAAACEKQADQRNRREESSATERQTRGNDNPAAPWGRWAFLCLGLIAGLLASSLWQSPQKSAPNEPEVTPVVQLPRILIVEPASPEYPTITKALEAARDGDRIEVGDGEYQELIRLKEGVDIAARSPGKAVLHLARTLPDMDAAIAADGIRRAGISGLTVKAEPMAVLPFGIRISNSSVHLSNMEISGAIRAGILVDGSSAGTIAACFVHANSGPGILISGSASPFLVGNVVHANGTTRNHTSPGLYLAEKSNPEVIRNVFSGNGAEAIRLQRRELKDRMMDNLFIGSGNRALAVVVERVRRP